MHLDLKVHMYEEYITFNILHVMHLYELSKLFCWKENNVATNQKKTCAGIRLRKEMGNVSKRQQPDNRADNSRRPPMDLQCSEKLQHP